MNQQRNDDDQVRRDIEDALQRAGADRLPPQSRPRRRLRLPFGPRPSGPGPVIIAGIVLVVLWRIGILGVAGTVVGMIGLLLLVFGIGTWLIRPRRRTVYWRERAIDIGGEHTWMERLYYWCYRG